MSGDFDSTYIEENGVCDQLLREFHRYDEELELGKWAGGTVTGVCRGWGTDKVRILMGSLMGDVNGRVENSLRLGRSQVFISQRY